MIEPSLSEAMHPQKVTVEIKRENCVVSNFPPSIWVSAWRKRSIKLLLFRLPEELPLCNSADYPLRSFTPDPEKLNEGLTAAVSLSFKKIFGWANSDLRIRARGLEVVLAAEVLAHYAQHAECQDNLGPIQAWVKKLTKMALDTYQDYGVQVSLSTH